jgi:hypothetical protein
LDAHQPHLLAVGRRRARSLRRRLRLVLRCALLHVLRRRITLRWSSSWVVPSRRQRVPGVDEGLRSLVALSCKVQRPVEALHCLRVPLFCDGLGQLGHEPRALAISLLLVADDLDRLRQRRQLARVVARRRGLQARQVARPEGGGFAPWRPEPPQVHYLIGGSPELIEQRVFRQL